MGGDSDPRLGPLSAPTQAPPAARLDGLDLARYLALVGMVVVNFDVVLVAAEGKGSSFVAQLFMGRAAATFVVLAGIGLGIAARRQALSVTLKRAAFLLVVGLANMLVFPADIIHYYAFYFLFGAACLQLSGPRLWAIIAALPVVWVGLLAVIDYDSGWNWSTLTYEGFWTPVGFVRNLLFNGWHPVLPWLSFLLLGIWLGRRRLGEPATQRLLSSAGAVVMLGAEAASYGLLAWVGPDSELASLLTTKPIPPAPLYVLAGGGAACFAVGLALRAAPVAQRAGILGWFTPAGRQTLTLYIAHILIGIGILDAAGLVGTLGGSAALACSAAFVVAATLYAWAWRRRYRRGPLEWLMRRATD